MTKKINYAVYMIKNTITNKCYVGQDSYFPQRWFQHLSKMRKNKSSCTKLQRAFNKYGEPSFTYQLLELTTNKQELVVKEQYWIDKLDAVNNGYNICPASVSMSGRKFGPQSLEQRQKISNALKGRIFSEEHRRKLSITSKGRTVSQETRIKRSIALTGKTRTIEQRKNCSIAAKKVWAARKNKCE